jgi:hypothetical protein
MISYYIQKLEHLKVFAPSEKFPRYAPEPEGNLKRSTNLKNVFENVEKVSLPWKNVASRRTKFNNGTQKPSKKGNNKFGE